MEVKPDRQMVAIHQWHGVDALAHRSCSVPVHKKVIDLVLGVGGGVSPGAGECVASERDGGAQLVTCQQPTKLESSRVQSGITVRSAHMVVGNGVAADGRIPVASHDKDFMGLPLAEDVLDLVKCVLAHRCQVS
jgi:hypothetical protein